MANVLVLKSSINGETSLTNQLINEFLAARQAAGHGDRLIEHDLSAMALPTLDRPLFAAPKSFLFYKKRDFETLLSLFRNL